LFIAFGNPARKFVIGDRRHILLVTRRQGASIYFVSARGDYSVEPMTLEEATAIAAAFASPPADRHTSFDWKDRLMVPTKNVSSRVSISPRYEVFTVRDTSGRTAPILVAIGGWLSRVSYSLTSSEAQAFGMAIRELTKTT
jgi:hypothetical protein